MHIYDSYDEVVDCYDLGLPPTQDSSHHQDYEPFLENREPQLLNLHLPLESWVGVDPSYDCYDCYDPQDWWIFCISQLMTDETSMKAPRSDGCLFLSLPIFGDLKLLERRIKKSMEKS